MQIRNRFNDDWKFRKSDVAEAQQVGLADGDWRTLSLPHDWSIEEPFSQEWASATGYLPGGVGWYRKAFTLPADTRGKQVYLHFDGVYCNSDVWINGHPLGNHPNGFTPFRYDLTPHLAPNGANTLAVRVDHTRFGDARWYTGSGIYRNVYLIVKEPVHCKQWGIFVTTPVVTENEAQVQTQVSVENHTHDVASVEIETVLRDGDGRQIAQAVAPLGIHAGGEAVTGTTLAVPAPRLWSPDQPYLYTLQVTVRHDGQVVDTEDVTVGIRSFRFDARDGFFLNGVNLKLKGVCLHDDAGALGVAVPPKVWERRLRLLKEAGTNAIRMAHNPHLPELYDLCDRMGFLVQDEAFDEWEGGKNKWIAGWNAGTPGKDGYNAHFAEWADADLRDMILSNRNHASIIMWSIGNEIDYPNDPFTHEVLETGTNPQSFGRGFKPDLPHSNRLGEIARHLVQVAKQFDTTRPVTAAISAALISNETGFADALDVVGYNYQEYRYAEDHARFPDRVLYGSENGMHRHFWDAVSDNPYISGQFLWTGIDYLGEAGKWPARSNTAGLMDLAGNPKPEYFYRKSLWNAAPMAYLATRSIPTGEEETNLWSHKRAEPVWTGTPGELVRVVCFTNGDQAELFLNGRLIGVSSREAVRSDILFWDLPYEPGTLTVKAYQHGEFTASYELRSSGPAAKIVAEADTQTIKADGEDLCHISVTVTDADGVPVYAADTEVTWHIDGPARLLGLESGDPTSHERYQSPTRRAFHGKLLGYLQATGGDDDVQVRLTAPGLQDATITLRTMA